MPATIDTKTLAQSLENDECIGENADVTLYFMATDNGIVCELRLCATCYSADVGCYPYGPADGVEYHDLPFRFVVPTEECGDASAWTSRGLAALDELDVAACLRENGYAEFFDEYLRNLDPIEREQEATEHPMNADDMLATYAKYIADDLKHAVMDIAHVLNQHV